MGLLIVYENYKRKKQKKQQRRQAQILEKVKSLRFREQTILSLAHFLQNQRITQKQLFVDYFTQVRHETIIRLIERCYNADGSQNKHWFQFSKRRFMNAWNM